MTTSCSNSMTEISQEALLARIEGAQAPVIVDVRTPQEFAQGHVPGAINIPHTEIEAQLDRLRPHQAEDVVVYCKSGIRAGKAAAVLSAAGFTRLLHLTGDMEAWVQNRRPVE